ncbi:diaminopimelate decarboxylase [soil metagenome]
MASAPSPSNRIALLAAADLFGTPLYVYFENVIRERCRDLVLALDGLPARVLYALTANANPTVLSTIHDEGFGFDAVSPGEVALLRHLGIDLSTVLYSATSLPDGEMDEMHAAGTVMNLDDLERLERFGRQHPGSRVCLRFNPGIGHGHHRHVVTGGKEAKFGLAIEDAPEARRIADRHSLRVIGIHQHVGSGVMDPELLWPAAERLIDVAVDFPELEFVDLGGGFGIPYRPDDVALDLKHLRSLTELALDLLNKAGHSDVEIWYEPGRYLVAQAGVLLAGVHTIKAAGGGGEAKTFIGTDPGFNQLIRPTLYGSYHALHNISNPEGEMHLYDVVGNICESGDLFAREQHVQEVRRGDVLAICDAGAYGMAMASNYNLRPMPAEAIVRESGEVELIRRRLTHEEVADLILNAAVSVA